MSEPVDPRSVGEDAGITMEERGEIRRRLRRRLSVLGCGCFAILLVLGAGLGLVVYKGVKNLSEDFADPERRTRKVLNHLGAETLPPGYHAVLSLDVPLPFHMVVLSDEPWVIDPPESSDTLPMFTGLPGDRLFFYIHIMTVDRSGQDPFEREFKSETVLDRDDLKVHGQLVAWEAHQGTFRRPDGPTPGVFARLRMECEDDQTRRAVWFVAADAAPSAGEPEISATESSETGPSEAGPSEAGPSETESPKPDSTVIEAPESDLAESAVPVAESAATATPAARYAGTPADPEAVVELLSHFNVCQTGAPTS